MRRLLILGSTGSIGTQALDVVERAAGEFELVGLSAGTAHEALVEQAAAHGVRRIALSDPDAAARAAESWTGGEVLAGPEGLVRLVAESGADLVLNAIVGSAGLGPTIVALTEGIDVALANKESLVVGGELVTALAEATGAQLIPVDSEHSALHQLIAGERTGTVDRLVVTASGGPFRGRTRAELEDVTVEQALQHPTWAMGGKITIDSATLMNKGLEVIEAHHLFGTPYERIDVVVHPQSIVHAMVSLVDGASLAHMGHPDMRVPIAYALHHPERVDVPVPRLDLARGRGAHLRGAGPGRLPLPAPLARGGDRRRHRAVRAQRRQRGRGPRLPRRPAAVHGHPGGDRADARARPAGRRALLRLALPGRRRRPRGRRRTGRGAHAVSWILAFLGFAALIVLHELGHFAAAKAVGMRVERFALFFPPLWAKTRRGETEYAIGSIPLGGYVKITGMNPAEEIPPEVEHRAYYRQPVWKRIVVIGAGPAVNIFIAFALLAGIYWANGTEEPPSRVASVNAGSPAAAVLQPGDELVAIDGRKPSGDNLRDQNSSIAKQIATHKCETRRAGLPRHRAGHAAGPPRRAAADAARHAGLRRRAEAPAAGLHVRRHGVPRRARSRVAAERRRRCGTSPRPP